MQAVALLLGLILVAVTVYLIAMPLVKPEQETQGPEWEVEETIEREKESIFTTLGEIEFDYQMNKLSDEDYEQLRNQYRRHAVEVLKAEETVPQPGPKQGAVSVDLEKEIEAEIEAEIQRLVAKQKGKKG